MAPPAWTSPELAAAVGEPFRSNDGFWSGLAASADALTGLAVAAAIAVALVLAGRRDWSFLPFAVPALLTVRAAVISAAASRRSRAAFADRRQWREAERGAVAAVFGRVLRHRFTRS